MKQLVSDAEHYLHSSSQSGGSSSSCGSNSGGDTDSQGGSSSCGGSTHTDSESIASSQPKSELSELSSSAANYGKLRHSDSLLLLTQVNEVKIWKLRRILVPRCNIHTHTHTHAAHT